MKNYLLLLLICFLALVGCNAKEKAVAERLEIKGIIIGIDIEGNRILVDDPDTGFIWLALPAHDDIKKYEEGLEVKVWIDGGIDTSSPAYAKAFMIKLLEEQFILHKFDFKNNEFPPYPYGFVEIDETSYEMATGASNGQQETKLFKQILLLQRKSLKTSMQLLWMRIVN